MYEIKTKENEANINEFISEIEDEQKRKDSQDLLNIFEEITKEKATMWSNGMIGFGKYSYESKSGCKGEWPLTAFAPRKANLVIYIMPGFTEYPHLMEKLGKHKTSVSCLYIKKLADIDISVLKELITLSIIEMKKRYPLES